MPEVIRLKSAVVVGLVFTSPSENINGSLFSLPHGQHSQAVTELDSLDGRNAEYQRGDFVFHALKHRASPGLKSYDRALDHTADRVALGLAVSIAPAIASPATGSMTVSGSCVRLKSIDTEHHGVKSLICNTGDFLDMCGDMNIVRGRIWAQMPPATQSGAVSRPEVSAARGSWCPPNFTAAV